MAINVINLFDIKSPEDFFNSLLRVREKYESKRTKYIEDLLYMILGLNHLREWIAPGYRYDKKKPAVTDEQLFFDRIHNDLEDFKTINQICNHSKHLRAHNHVVDTNYSNKLSDWDDLSSVESLAEGVPVSYTVDDNDVLEIIDSVIDFYKLNWFEREI